MNKLAYERAGFVGAVGAVFCLGAMAAAAQTPQAPAPYTTPQIPGSMTPSTVIQPPAVPTVVKPPVINLPDPVKPITPPPGGQPGAPAQNLVATFDPLWLIGHSDGVLMKSGIKGHVSPDLAGYGIVVSRGDQLKAAEVLRSDAAAIGYPLHLDSDSTIEIEPDDTAWLVSHIEGLLSAARITGTVDNVQFTVSTVPSDEARAKSLLKSDSSKVGYTTYFF